MTYKVVCTIKDNQVILTLPPDFKNKKEVTVFIDDQVDTKSLKVEALRAASNDPLFLADIKEVLEDFNLIDHETI
jgi:hypothetical protein